MADGFERNTRTVMVLTFLSRITGLLRDATLSRILGTHEAMSAFGFAFLIPNLFRRLFGEGALSAAFLPTYQRLSENDAKRAAALAGAILGGLAAGLGALVVVGEAVLFLTSAAYEHENMAVWFMMMTLPYAPLVCSVAIVGAMLHVHGRFGPTAAAPLVLNGCLILAATVGWYLIGAETPRERMMVAAILSGSVVLAGILQVAWSMLVLRRTATWTLDLASARTPMGEVLRRAGPMILGLGVLQLNTLLDGLIASVPLWFDAASVGINYPMDDHSLAVLQYAQRLYQFPLGVFGIAVATAIYPLLTRRKDEPGPFVSTVRRGVRLVLFISVPAGVGLILVREPLTEVILQGGAFDAADTSRVAFVLLGYATCIWAYMLGQVLTRAFYARDEVKTPVRIAVAMVGLNLALNLTLIWPLHVAGLAWSTAACAMIQSIIMAVILHRRGVSIFNAAVVTTTVRICVATAIMAAVVGGVMAVWTPGETWIAEMIRLTVVTAAGAAVVLACAVALRMPELRWALGLEETP
ncbi:MAG: murein biosynthesis integral membrane protein MurJ [Phycisphaerales bacterium]|jgi:putative peptidoglycan lipid II flippase|nr:murein biosynthesis integral membrane protein MurJ [Phycisphaerales bacterium]